MRQARGQSPFNSSSKIFLQGFRGLRGQRQQGVCMESFERNQITVMPQTRGENLGTIADSYNQSVTVGNGIFLAVFDKAPAIHIFFQRF